MSRVTVVMIFLLILMVGTIFLQIFLSRQESRWPGLILPGISFSFSLVMVLSIAALNQGIGQIVATVLGILLLGNLPTLILLAIYAACRPRRNKRREIEKMNLSDL